MTDIVVDPEDAAQIQRLADAISAATGYLIPPAQLQAAARRFVTPRPDEPAGIGAVIEDQAGVSWVRWHADAEGEPPWIGETGVRARYVEIDAVTVRSDGWIR